MTGIPDAAARAAFEAYCAATLGQPTVAWPDLPDEARNGWRAALGAALKTPELDRVDDIVDVRQSGYDNGKQHGAAVERARIRKLADKWSDEAARYARDGQPGRGYERNGDSPSHRSCRQIAKTLAEVAGELRAWLEDQAGPGTYERLFFPATTEPRRR